MSTHWYAKRTHHGVVLDVSSNGFDRGASAFSSIFIDDDEPDTLFMFYSGARDVSWSHSAIGLATSRDSLRFRKVGENPVFEGTTGSFCCKEALTPAVTKIGNRYLMVFSGRPSENSFRRLGFAWADDPKGPWSMISGLTKSSFSWRNGHIENGPSLVKLDDETVLVFYSNTSSAGLDVVNFLKQLVFRGELSLAWLDIPTFLRRYLMRSIGLIKLRIRGTSKSGIEVYHSSGNWLKHLNGKKASWHESLFCPGYFNLKGVHHLVPATSVYSLRRIHRRYIGILASDSPYFNRTVFRFDKLIDGPMEKSSIMPGIKGEICLDSPSPLLSQDDRVLFLYYSVMDNRDNVWKTALTTFNLKEE